MAISTSIAGYWRRFDGDNLELDRRISDSVTVTEYGGNKIVLASSDDNVSLMPAGLVKATALYIESSREVNVELTGAINASFDIGVGTTGALALMYASLSDVKVSNRNATACNVFYDISG